MKPKKDTPCDISYKKGESWTEELGCSLDTFNKLFDMIGVRYQSKKDFLSEPDPFKGKLYASYYHDADKNLAFYIRNNKVADEFFPSKLKPRKNKLNMMVSTGVLSLALH